MTKMAAEEKQGVNDALETVVSITEKSGNLRKDLKKRHPNFGKYIEESIFPSDSTR